jgi:SAM-dependent methyltransferase
MLTILQQKSKKAALGRFCSLPVCCRTARPQGKVAMAGILRALWPHVRRVLPVQCYPLLAPISRWERSRALRRLEQHDREFRADRPHLLAPPAELRVNVVGECTIEQFLDGGRRTAREIETALEAAGFPLRDIAAFLDFGCGCGRLLLEARHRWRQAALFGADVDRRAIDWCRRALPEVQLAVNDALPPLPFEANQFDLVWAGSVFTHLDEARQDAWLTDLRRVLRPGGLLLASVHGPHCWEGLPPPTVAAIQEQGFVYAQTSSRGIHPDWYQTAWHTEAYVRRHWGDYFQIRAYLPRGFGQAQDIVAAASI